MAGDFAALTQLSADAAHRDLAARRASAGVGADQPIEPGSDDRALLSALTSEMTGFAVNAERTLFGALEDEVEFEEFLSRASQISEQGEAFPNYAARLLAAFLVIAREGGNVARRVSDHRIARDLGEAVQHAMLLVVYARLIAANLTGQDANRWYGHEKRRLDTRIEQSRVPEGADTPIGDVAEVDEGALVRLEGFVESLRIEDDPAPPKFSTFFGLNDPVAGVTLKIRAHQFSLAANGLADGSYIRLNGWVRRDQSWLGAGETGIEIDRVALGELSRESWCDDVTFRMRDYFSLYLDGMSLFHTPQLLTGENQDVL